MGNGTGCAIACINNVRIIFVSHFWKDVLSSKLETRMNDKKFQIELVGVTWFISNVINRFERSRWRGAMNFFFYFYSHPLILFINILKFFVQRILSFLCAWWILRRWIWGCFCSLHTRKFSWFMYCEIRFFWFIRQHVYDKLVKMLFKDDWN